MNMSKQQRQAAQGQRKLNLLIVCLMCSSLITARMISPSSQKVKIQQLSTNSTLVTANNHCVQNVGCFVYTTGTDDYL